LRIHELAVDCRLGVYEWEQRTPQTVWIDLELSIDAARAAARDDVRDAVDYAVLVERVRAAATGRPFALMETLAEGVAAAALDASGSPRVRVRVRKRALEGLSHAEVEVERTSRAARTGRSGRGSTTRTTIRSPRAART
jgi:dihydroneopterin aldolase